MSIVKSSIVITAISFSVSIVSFINQILIANYFGASEQMDMYLFASSFPLLISALVTSGLSYSLTPYLVKTRNDIAINYPRFLGNMLMKLSISAFLLFLLTAIIVVFYLTYSKAVFAGNSEKMILEIAIVSCFTSFFSVILCFLNSVFNAEQVFNIPVILSFSPYLFTTAFTTFFHSYFGSLSISLGLFFGTVFSMSVAFLIQKKKISFNIVENKITKDINSYFLKIPGIAIAMLCFSIYQTVDAFWAPRLGAANLSYLGYCQRLLIAFGALVITGPSTVLVPRLTLAIAQVRRNDFLNDSVSVIKLIIALSSLVAVIGSFLSKDIIIVLFQRGAFTTKDTDGVAGILPYMLIGMIFMLCVVMLFRAFFASDTNLQVLGLGILATVIYFVFSGLGSYYFGVKGIAMSYVLTWGIVFLLSLKLIFRNNYQFIINKQTIQFIGKQLLLLVIVFLVVIFSKIGVLKMFSFSDTRESLVVLFFSGTVGTLTYLVLSSTLIPQPEIITLLKKMKLIAQ